MFWTGRGAKTLPQIIGAYDSISRLIVSRSELEDALNFLLAASLIEWDNGRYRIPGPAYSDFENFLKKRKRNKFDVVRLYFERLPGIGDVARKVQLSDDQFDAHVSEYRRMLRRASKAGRNARK